MKTLIRLIKNSGLFALISGAVFWILYLILFAINKGKNLGEYEYLLTLAKYCRDTGIVVLIFFGILAVAEADARLELESEQQQSGEEEPISRRR